QWRSRASGRRGFLPSRLLECTARQLNACAAGPCISLLRKASMSLFDAVEMAPRDPILGLNEQFNADANPSKVNLGVGVYYDDVGRLPLLQCVAEAERRMMDKPAPRGYLPIDGIALYDRAVQGLVFGADSEAVKSSRVATVQAL